MNLNLLIPQNYNSDLSLKETAIAIKNLKDFFESELSKQLNLTRVSAPLFVKSSTGLNDNLNGVESPVSFKIKAIEDSKLEIIHSLAKWKRNALKEYNFKNGEGLYTDMNAIRKDEELDNIHSIYVDQWDWEKVISKDERNDLTLESIVKIIYSVFKSTENYITSIYPNIKKKLPENIFFITAEELYRMYPNLTAKEREDTICKEKGAVFIKSIGGLLSSGEKHDSRSPDYDDWELNGDLLFYYPLLNKSLELSSMGIRVDSKSLLNQLESSNCLERKNLPFHQKLLNDKLPYTVGGGIGQSRICMFFLNKAHIGEVQSSIWDDETVNICKANNINLL